MSEMVVRWLTLIGGVVGQLIIAAFVYGKLTATVSGTAAAVAREESERKAGFERVDKEQDEQWRDINANGRSIEKIKGRLQLNGGE